MAVPYRDDKTATTKKTRCDTWVAPYKDGWFCFPVGEGFPSLPVFGVGF